MTETGKPLPKFGEWDVTDPSSSANDFSVIFNKARNERKYGTKVSPKCRNSPNYNAHDALRKSHYKKWFCCMTRPAEP
ncbi:RPM1-interacting protein 4 [Vigna radiata var. radiata]|uniref:RPM1-interacting protein 4 n=1 Tax=Vigna radiata var. radiata TaxID=3916 RepID=A0A1S3UE41_VIGRR|nr:RPM1-interacting protein 4 [Vigna radiata var. radiata]